MHKTAYPENNMDIPNLPSGGIYQWKKDGESHLWNPESIAALQDEIRQIIRESRDQYRAEAEKLRSSPSPETATR